MAKGQLRKAYKGQELALSDKGEEPMAKILIFRPWIEMLRSPSSDSRTNILQSVECENSSRGDLCA